MTRFFELLPEIATQPLALVAYITVALGWIAWLFRRRRSIDFLKALESLPESERSAFSKRAGYTYDDLANLTRAQRVRLVMGRWFFLGFIATLLAIVLIAIASITTSKELAAANTQLYEKNRELDEISTKVQELRAIVNKTHGYAQATAIRDASPEARQLAAEVIGLIASVRISYAAELTDTENLALRVGEAAAHIGKQENKKALDKVTDKDAAEARQRTEQAELELVYALAEESSLCWVLGNAQDGLREWNEALPYFERILENDPNDIASLTAISHCWSGLGRNREALVGYEKVVTHYTRLVVDKNRNELADELAGALINHGKTLDVLGKLEVAIKDYGKAIQILTPLVEQQGRDELANKLASALNNRGVTLSSRGKLEDAIKDYDKAIQIRTRLVKQEGRDELANDLARALNNRGSAFGAQARFEDAIMDFDEAIQIRTPLVEQEGRDELANDLAMTFHNRGIAHLHRDRPKEAIKDFDKAIQMLTPLVEQEGRTELEHPFAMALTSHGVALLEQGRLELAIKHFDKAIQILTPLVEQQGRYELANDLAGALNNRGFAYSKLSHYQVALSDFDRAIDLRKHLVENRGMTHLAEQLRKTQKVRQRILDEMQTELKSEAQTGPTGQ